MKSDDDVLCDGTSEQVMALQHTDFDLFDEGLCHGLDDAEPLPLFDPFNATFGGFGRKMKSNVSAFSPSRE